VSDLSMVHPSLTELRLKYIETLILGRIRSLNLSKSEKAKQAFVTQL
jgi:hypothetical protein